jgi:transposase InsO family protein
MTDRSMAQRFRQHHVRNFQNSKLSQREYCSLPGSLHRNTLRKYLHRFQAGGDGALLSLTPQRCPANQTNLDDEAAILNYVKHHPGPSAQRIANELAGRIRVGHNGVHGVLTRHGISRRPAREEWSRKQLGEVVTLSEIETARQKAKTRSLEVSFPGELWGQDTFLIGRLKGIGKIYHYLAVDIASSFAIATIYTDRTAQNACDFLSQHLVPKSKNLGVCRLLQDNGTEYTAARWRNGEGASRHQFEQLAGQLGIKLTFIKPAHPWTNGSCERLHQTLLHEFYIPALCSKQYASVEELNYDLQLFLHWYNYKRTHMGRRLRGKVPAQVYFSGKTASSKLILRIA